MAQIPEDKIAEVRDRLDIVEVIGRSVALRKVGRSWKGSCPFHHEKTPSFHVDPVRNLYHCFGCQAGGDVFRFVMEREGKTFPEAVRMLAAEVGVNLPPPGRISSDPQAEAKHRRRESLLHANEKAAESFENWLFRDASGKAGREHLKARGIGSEVARSFGLGFAPLRNDLGRRLVRASVSESVLQEAGLIARGQREETYERFRGRLMVPIRDPDGRVLAFGARIVEGDHPAKYLNSPETPLYRKSATLFGLDRARASIRRSGAAVVVEGYFDVIALAQAGIDNAVATCGTALTLEHCRLLARHAKDVYLVFDGDEAGSEAAARTHDVVTEVPALTAWVVSLPEGEDPDSFVREQGADAFRTLCGKAQPLVQVLVDRALGGFGGGTVEARVRAAERVRPILARVRDPMTHRLYLEKVADRLGLDEKVLADHLRKPVKKVDTRSSRSMMEAPSSDPMPADEEALCMLLLEKPDLLEEPLVEESVSNLADERSIELLTCLLARRREGGQVDVGEALEKIEDMKLRSRWRAHLARVGAGFSCESAMDERADDIARKLRLVLARLERLAEARRRESLARRTAEITDPVERARMIQAEKQRTASRYARSQS